MLTLLLVPERTEKGLGMLRKALGRVGVNTETHPANDPLKGVRDDIRPQKIPKGRGRVQALVLRALKANRVHTRTTLELATATKLKPEAVSAALSRITGARYVKDPATGQRGWVYVSKGDLDLTVSGKT